LGDSKMSIPDRRAALFQPKSRRMAGRQVSWLRRVFSALQ